MLGECDLCGKTAELNRMLYNNEDDKYLCSDCWDKEEARADFEYERQREEGNIK